MAYRGVAMWEILIVLERLHRGESQRSVERVTAHSRKTIRSYLATVSEIGWEPGGKAPTEAVAAEVYRRTAGGVPERQDPEMPEDDDRRPSGKNAATIPDRLGP